MSPQLLTEITVFILAVFVGFEVISKVPSMLHTPLMSATNAIHGIVVVGAMLIAGAAIGGTVGQGIGLAAMVLATINVVGGFAVTGRMLQMFKAKAGPKA
ncbi:MAG TPA: NAD(P) transhydrogenase subunit alpha [Candidatus Eremiobacteraceae bacterium]|jgi:NAD(P) transhydrogenase subunit alpha